MQRAFVFILTALSVPAAVNAQSADAEIARALAPAPARAQADATVISLDADGQVTVLRQGSNGIMCWDASSAEGFSATCTSEANRARVQQNYAFNHSIGTPDEIRAKFDEAERNGTRALSEFGTMYYHLDGSDQASARSHISVVVPFATAESLGLPDTRNADRAWIMAAGTSTAHLMIPGR
jgi:hypothetical protein